MFLMKIVMRSLFVAALLIAGALRSAAATLVPPVLVLVPENRTGKLEHDWIGLSVSRYLSHRLLPMLDVASITPDRRLAGFETMAIPANRAVTRATMLRVAAELKASFVLFGSYETRADGDLQVTVTPLDAVHMAIGKAISVKGKPEELISIENTIGYGLVKEYFTDPDRVRSQILGRDAGVPVTAYEALARSFGITDPEKRLPWLRKAIAAHPGYAEAILEQAQILYVRGDFGAVMRMLSSPTAEHADRFNFLRGLACFSSRDYAQASALFSTLASKPSFSEAALNNLAAARSEQGDQEQAAFYLKSALPQAASAASLYFNLGVVSQRAGHTDAAIAAFKESARRDPDDWQAQTLLAHLLAQNGQREESLAIVAIAAKRMPQHSSDPATLLRPRLRPLPEGCQPEGCESVPREVPPAASRAAVIGFHLERGRVLCEKQMWTEAAGELRKVLYLDPYDGNARYLLARAYLGTGDLEHALIEAKMSLWSQESAAAHMLLARILGQMGRHDEARSEAMRVLQIEPGNAEARAFAGV